MEFRLYCKTHLLLLAEDLIRLLQSTEQENRSIANILRTIFSPGDIEGSTIQGFPVDDDCLVSLLELVFMQPIGEMVEFAHALLKQRTLNSGVVVVTSSASCAGSSGLVKNVRSLTKSILFSGGCIINKSSSLLMARDSIPVHANPVPVHDTATGSIPFQCTSSVPFQRRSSLAVMVAGLKSVDSSATSQVSSQSRPYLCLKERLLRNLVVICSFTLPRAQLLLLLCQCSHHAREILESMCETIRNRRGVAGVDASLWFMERYLACFAAGRWKSSGAGIAGCVSKQMRKDVLERCVEIVQNADSVFTKDQRV